LGSQDKHLGIAHDDLKGVVFAFRERQFKGEGRGRGRREQELTREVEAQGVNFAAMD
jgi:hypothetical protein